jgi:serine/threonine protein kinase
MSLVGQCLAERFELEQCIGNGTAGDTYRAKHREQQRSVVVKVFHGDVRDHALRRQRFELEAGRLAELSHPNTPEVLGFGVHDGRGYIVREWLEGETLAKRLEAGPLSPEAAMSIARQLLAALAAAQSASLSHRNLHPGNVFLESRKRGGQRVKLLDFALAWRAARTDSTRYTPPEQRAGGLLDARSDVFAVGVLVDAMLRQAGCALTGGAGTSATTTQLQSSGRANENTRERTSTARTSFRLAPTARRIFSRTQPRWPTRQATATAAKMLSHPQQWPLCCQRARREVQQQRDP